MQIPELIKVSKKSILGKKFNVDISKLSQEEIKVLEPYLPTQEEKTFMEIYHLDAPQLVRLQRKMSVCLDVEVTELEEEKVSFVYGGSTYTILSPKNAFGICSALEKSKIQGFVELGLQGCLLKNGNLLDDVRKVGVLAVDEMQVLSSVADKFFFQTCLDS